MRSFFATSTWTYAHVPPPTGSSISTTTVVDPLNNETDYTFSGGYEVQRLIYQGCLSSTPGCTITSGRVLLETVLTCYNGNQTNCGTVTTAPSLPINQIDKYTLIAGKSTQSRSTTLFDAYNNVTDTKAYDFVCTTAATPVCTAPTNETVITYGSYSRKLWGYWQPHRQQTMQDSG